MKNNIPYDVLRERIKKSRTEVDRAYMRCENNRDQDKAVKLNMQYHFTKEKLEAEEALEQAKDLLYTLVCNEAWGTSYNVETKQYSYMEPPEPFKWTCHACGASVELDSNFERIVHKEHSENCPVRKAEKFLYPDR